MADKIGGIYVDLGLNSTAFSTGLTKAQGQVGKFAAVTKSSLGNLGKAAFGGLAAGALSTIAPILGMAAAVDSTKRALAEFDSIAKSAKASGLDGEFFQEIAYQADLGGVGVDKLSGALETFNKNAGLAAAGKGRMITALKALNPELLKNITAAKTQEERLRIVADALDKEADASRKAAIATSLFGDSGTRMVEALKGGSKEMARLASEARSLGLVVSNDLLANSERLSDELSVASKILDMQFKQAMVGLAPILVSTAQLIGDVSAAIGGLVNEMQAFENRSTASLQGRLDTINAILGSAATDVTLPSGEIVNSNPMALSPGGGDIEAMKAERAELEKILAVRKAIAVETAPPAATTGGNLNADAQAKVDAAKAVLASLQFELEQLKRNNLEQQIYNNLKQAGVTAESAMGQQIAAATTELDRQRLALEANAEAMKLIMDTAESTFRGMIDDLLAGTDAADTFANALKNIGGQLLNMGIGSIFGTGGGSGLFGELLGIPGRASGGPVSAGQPYIVGEKRPELFVPNVSGRIVPHVPSIPKMGGGGSVTAPITFNVDARGADSAAIARLQTTVAQMKADLPATVISTVRRARATANL